MGYTRSLRERILFVSNSLHMEMQFHFVLNISYYNMNENNSFQSGTEQRIMDEPSFTYKTHVNPKLKSNFQLYKEWKACEYEVLAKEIKNREFRAELYNLHT